MLLGALVRFESVVLAFYTNEILLEFVLGMGCYAFYRHTAAWRTAGIARQTRTALIVMGVACIVCLPSAVCSIPGWGAAAAGAFPPRWPSWRWCMAWQIANCPRGWC